MPSRGGRRRTSATIKNHRELRDCKKDTVEKTTYYEKTTGNHIVPNSRNPAVRSLISPPG